jgi:hypothetical protein
MNKWAGLNLACLKGNITKDYEVSIYLFTCVSYQDTSARSTTSGHSFVMSDTFFRRLRFSGT